MTSNCIIARVRMETTVACDDIAAFLFHWNNCVVFPLCHSAVGTTEESRTTLTLPTVIMAWRTPVEFQCTPGRASFKRC
jgi:hypothetical protein